MPAVHAIAAPSPEDQRRARLFGGLFALTIVTSIAGLLLYGPVLDDPDHVLTAGSDARVHLGALSEIVLAIANIGTAVVIWPVLRRRHRSLALAYVASRIVESTVIVVGLISLLAVVSLRTDPAGTGADPESLEVVGRALVAVHDMTFLLGPGFCVGVNGIVLGWLFLKTAVVPPRIARFGVVGGPLIFASSIAVLFGVYEQDGVHFLFSVPEIVFELSITVFTLWKGFRPAAVFVADAASAPGADGPARRRDLAIA